MDQQAWIVYKCKRCRKDQRRCQPKDRIWPQKCNRCIERGWECSENERVYVGRSNMPAIHDLTLRVVWLRRLKHYVGLGCAIPSIKDDDFGYRDELDTTEKILRQIEDEKASIASDIKSSMDTYSLTGYSFVIVSYLALLLSTENCRLDCQPILLTPNIVHQTQRNSDVGLALAMQEARLVEGVQSSDLASEVQRYCGLHSDNLERLKTEHIFHTIPMPPLHCLLSLTQSVDLLSSISGKEQPTGQTDMLNRSLLHVALDLGIGGISHVPYLFDKSAPVIDIFGRSPLHAACFGGLYQVVMLLLNKGADIDLQDSWGQTPLFYAVRGGQETIVKLLLDKGTSVDAVSGGSDVTSPTPLLYAVRGGHEAIVRLLLKKNPCVDVKDKDRTPLSYAAEKGQEAVVKLLLDAGAGVDVGPDYWDGKTYGRTPLSYAAEKGHKSVVELLLKWGAKVDLVDDMGDWKEYGRTALSYAAEGGHEAVVRLLLEKNANAELKDNKERAPLSYATRGGHEAVIQLLLEKRQARTERMIIID